MPFDQLFDDWIKNIINSAHPGKHIIAYYFGLMETESCYTLYFVGSKAYDPDDDDWATDLGDYQPKNNYLLLPEDKFKGLDCEEVLKIITKTLKKFCKSDAFKNSFLNDARAIATGFDDSDLIIIHEKKGV